MGYGYTPAYFRALSDGAWPLLRVLLLPALRVPVPCGLAEDGSMTHPSAFAVTVDITPDRPLPLFGYHQRRETYRADLSRTRGERPRDQRAWIAAPLLGVRRCALRRGDRASAAETAAAAS